jgi:hypothetical protein
MVFPQVRYQFGVAMCSENMPTGLKFSFELGVVEKFAVENGLNAAVFAAHGLLTVCQTNNTEPSVGKTDSRFIQETFFIWPTVNDGTSHGPQSARRYLPPTARKVDHSSNSAHGKAPK